jgi:hypothetical protein
MLASCDGSGEWDAPAIRPGSTDYDDVQALRGRGLVVLLPAPRCTCGRNFVARRTPLGDLVLAAMREVGP